MFENISKPYLKYVNTTEIITKAYDDPFLNNSNKYFDYVG